MELSVCVRLGTYTHSDRHLLTFTAGPEQRKVCLFQKCLNRLHDSLTRDVVIVLYGDVKLWAKLIRFLSVCWTRCEVHAKKPCLQAVWWSS